MSGTPDRIRGIPLNVVMLDDAATFVPDKMRCNACGYVGDEFWYDKNPKNLPAIEPPMLFLLSSTRTETAEDGTTEGRLKTAEEAERDLATAQEARDARLKAGTTVSIADIFGCARTGEEGASRCMKCNSLDVSDVA